MANRLYYAGMTPEWLEKRRATLIAARALGKAITVVQAAGVRTEMQVEVNVRTALLEVEHDLCIVMPEKYKPEEVMPIKRTRPRYLYS